MLVTNEVLAANKVGGIKDSDKLIEKRGKLSKTKKLSKSQKSAKSRKKSSKSGNLPNFDAKENGPSFLTPNTRTAFNYLRLAFIKALILGHFNPECHIQTEINASGYAINGVLSSLVSKTRPDKVVTKTNLGQWHPVAFFSRKMISVETWYKTHNGELLAIVKVFKT